MARAELRAARKINQALARIRAEVDAVLASSLPAGGAR
jgi:hypothetical protein